MATAKADADTEMNYSLLLIDGYQRLNSYDFSCTTAVARTQLVMWLDSDFRLMHCDSVTLDRTTVTHSKQVSHLHWLSSLVLATGHLARNSTCLSDCGAMCYYSATASSRLK